MEAFRFVAAPALVLALLAFAPVDASVEEVCDAATKGSEYYDYCISTLKPAASDGNADFYALAMAAAKLSKETFESNLVRIDELLRNTGMDKPSERALRACANVYGRGATKLQQAVGRLESRDFYGGWNYLSTSRDEAVSCGDVFTKFGIQSLLQSENDRALKLSFLAIHIAQNLN